MEKKHTETKWPDAVRLKMVEKSEFYQEPRIYQYGFYDGYQLACNNHYSLLEALKEVVRISDRKHDAWDKAREAIKNVEGK